MKNIDFSSIGRFRDKKQNSFFIFLNFSFLSRKSLKIIEIVLKRDRRCQVANVTTSLAESIEWLHRGAHHAKSNGVLKSYEFFVSFLTVSELFDCTVSVARTHFMQRGDYLDEVNVFLCQI